jgi:hypothetical protein
MSKKLQTILFVTVCTGILVFFLVAPESTTPRMPLDGSHESRQKDYSVCFNCHPPDTLPPNHTLDGKTPPPGKSKCYFCHKLEKGKDSA